MKLIKIIEENFKASYFTLNRNTDGSFNLLPQVFSMKSDALSKIFELPFCDEFKEVQLKIIDSPSINGNSIKTQRFDKNTILGFGPGTLFLYQINTIDFKTFDLRYHYEFSKGKTYYRGHDLSELNDEQNDKIKEMINDSSLSFSMMPNYIENRILDFKRENTAQKMIEYKNAPNEDKSYNKISIEMERIESVLESCDGLDDEQILLLKEKIKNFENKLKDKVKPKTITISSVVHNKIKNYCNTFGLKIGDWVEETLLNALDCTDKKPLKPQTQEEWLEESREELLRKWREHQKINKLIKTDLLILKTKFKFKGFSIVDHKPMYDYLGTDKELQNDLESIKCKVYLTTDKRELDNLTYLNEFADMPVEGFDINLPEEAVDLEKLTSDGFKKLISILSGKR